jgi:hypothetical protein
MTSLHYPLYFFNPHGQVFNVKLIKVRKLQLYDGRYLVLEVMRPEQA